jgi:LDH2 family malate/lactate/ureidoglycolate dehydrogenase
MQQPGGAPGVNSTVVKSASDLESFARDILVAAGASEQNATRVAEALVSSNLCGVDTHGVWHMPGYVDSMKKGEIDGRSRPGILSETGNTALVSGGWTFGHVGAKYAAEVAIEKAKKSDLSVVGVVQAHHIGRLGEYVELAASAGLISMIWAGGFAEDVPAAAPFGGRERVLHTNPIAMAFPSNGARPSMMFDFATTALSGVKIHEAREKHQQLPPGAIIDKRGNPTTEPSAFFEGGAHLPFGGHKGYAFMLAAEYLGRIFTGADTYAGEEKGGAIFGHSGTSIMAFRADLFQPAGQYRKRAQATEARIRSVPPAPGFEEVLMPGDLEARTRAIRKRDGIPIPTRVWDKLTDLACSLGLAVD